MATPASLQSATARLATGLPCQTDEITAHRVAPGGQTSFAKFSGQHRLSDIEFWFEQFGVFLHEAGNPAGISAEEFHMAQLLHLVGPDEHGPEEFGIYARLAVLVAIKPSPAPET